MPRDFAAVPIRPPMAATSSVPSMTMTPTSPGLAESIISTECLTASAGVAFSGGAALTSAVAARPTNAPDDVGPHVVREIAALAQHLVDGVGHRRHGRLAEAGNQRIGRRRGCAGAAACRTDTVVDNRHEHRRRLSPPRAAPRVGLRCITVCLLTARTRASPASAPCAPPLRSSPRQCPGGPAP